jgi:hypothetical protein
MDNVILIIIRDNINDTFESLQLKKVTIEMIMKVTKIPNKTKIFFISSIFLIFS